MVTVILIFWCICFAFLIIKMEEERREMGETVVEYYDYIKERRETNLWLLWAMLMVFLFAPLFAATWEN